MKWIYRIVTIAILIGAFALPFFIDNQQGEPMLSLPKLEIPGITSETSSPSHTNLVPPTANTVTAYKWQDQNGQWHYGDAPPADQSNIQVLNIRSDVNIVQGLQPAETRSNDSAKAGQVADEMTPLGEDFLSLERAKNVMQDAKLAAEAMNARNDELSKLVGDQ